MKISRKNCLNRAAFLSLLLTALLLTTSEVLWAQTNTVQNLEFVTLRWGGRDNTHAIFPDGHAESFRDLFRSVSRPDRTDDRAFYMNVAMNSLGREGFDVAGFTADEVVMKRQAGSAWAAKRLTNSAPRSEAESRLLVTRVCLEGNELRLQFFDKQIQNLQKDPSGLGATGDIEELKRLRAGEFWLQQSLATFTKYVVANKPFAVTSEELQQAITDSQERLRYFNKSLGALEHQRQNNEVTSEEFSKAFDLNRTMQDHELFLQQVLVGFSQEKSQFEQQQAGMRSRKGLWQQAGDSTFERLLNFAILGKLLQNPQPTTVIINR